MEGIDVRHIDVTETSRIALPPVATSSKTNSATPRQQQSSESRIPTPTIPRQYDAHVRTYRRYVAQSDKKRQKEEIERRTTLRAGLKIKAKPVTITAKPIRIEEKTSLKNKYIVKLPITRVNEVTTPVKQLPTPIKRNQNEWSQRETTKTVTERIERLNDEECTLQACKKTNGRHNRALVLITTQLWDECEEEMIDHDHPVCNECAGKIKHKMWGERVTRRRAYDEKIVEISTQIVSFTETYKTKRGEDAELLCELLHDAPMNT